MGFTRKIKYYLVHTLRYSNKAAQALLDQAYVAIDGQLVRSNVPLTETSEIKVNGETVRPATAFVYYKFNKPRGFQSSLSQKVPDNLGPFFPPVPALAIAGRLDRESEGLLLLSDDGRWVASLCDPKKEKEKEYLVTLDPRPDAAFVRAFSAGNYVGESPTRPCFCEIAGGSRVRIILTEGKNRQIRRICRKLGYEVTSLVRTRIHQFTLGNLLPGEFEIIVNQPDNTI